MITCTLYVGYRVPTVCLPKPACLPKTLPKHIIESKTLAQFKNQLQNRLFSDFLYLHFYVLY